MRIREVIIVEGRDDTAALKRAVDCETIETHGFGMSEDMWKRIERAHESNGIIVFTDPDSAGGRIRKKILERFPDAAEAHLPRTEAVKGLDIGVENASPEAIREALSKVRLTEAPRGAFTMEDLQEAGLCGAKGSRELRETAGDRLGIGFCNAKTFLKRLNRLGVTREEFYGALRSADDPIHQK